MEPGRSLDVEVARRVVRLAVIIDPNGDEHRMVDAARHRIVPVPRYSSDDNDVYYLINMLQGRGFTCNVNSNVATGNVMWTVTFSRGEHVGHGVSSTSMPHAACLAALDLLTMAPP